MTAGPFALLDIKGGSDMRQFDFTVTEAVGIHARPASILVKEALRWKSRVSIDRAGKQADVKKLLALMALGVKCGETVVFLVDGEDEEDAAAGLQAFCAANL